MKQLAVICWEGFNHLFLLLRLWPAIANAPLQQPGTPAPNEYMLSVARTL